MQLKNNFTERTRELFDFCYECWVCGKNHWNCLHHILGRVSNSPLNAAPVNNLDCHIGKGFNFEDNKRLLQKTYKYLIRVGYRLTDKDRAFMKKYAQYYKNGNINS